MATAFLTYGKGEFQPLFGAVPYLQKIFTLSVASVSPQDTAPSAVRVPLPWRRHQGSELGAQALRGCHLPVKPAEPVEDDDERVDRARSFGDAVDQWLMLLGEVPNIGTAPDESGIKDRSAPPNVQGSVETAGCQSGADARLTADHRVPAGHGAG